MAVREIKVRRGDPGSWTGPSAPLFLCFSLESKAFERSPAAPQSEFNSWQVLGGVKERAFEGY